MNGCGGNDKLTGGSKNDKLEGNDGKDKFEDEEGKTVFTGGKCDDLFIVDDDCLVKITDFNSKEDKLQIDYYYKKFQECA